jgi:hypothetical protein
LVHATWLAQEKSTKSDDAATPEYLWEEHLLTDGYSSWQAVKLVPLRSACNLMRLVKLRWWKQKVLTSLLTWLDRKNEVVQTQLNAIECDASQQRQHRIYKLCLNSLRRLYSFKWTTDGRKTYHAWWYHWYHRWHSNLEPGYDAVARTGCLSWWNLDDGSRPLN